MVITHIKDICCENINWESVGTRFKQFRETRDISRLEASQDLGVPESGISSLEKGYSKRKATNIIWDISRRWDLSINWLLNGIGEPYDPDPLDLIPETLHVQKGAGIRRNPDRAEAEEGNYSDCVLEFVMAVDKFKIKNKIPFPPLTQIYELVLALGYRKSAPSRIAPLGYIVEEQQRSEKLRHTNEKIDTHLIKQSLCPEMEFFQKQPVMPKQTVKKTKTGNSIMDRIRVGIQ